MDWMYQNGPGTGWLPENPSNLTHRCSAHVVGAADLGLFWSSLFGVLLFLVLRRGGVDLIGYLKLAVLLTLPVFMVRGLAKNRSIALRSNNSPERTLDR